MAAIILLLIVCQQQPKAVMTRFLQQILLPANSTLLRFCSVIAFCLSLNGISNAAIINEPMTGVTAPGWVIGGSASLTASTGIDLPDEGWLRLTDLGLYEAGYAYLDTAFNISAGAIISFDYVTYGGAGDGGFGCGTTGADGYSVYLFDASQPFSVGASGGSLGYAQKTGIPGLKGGYIGVGIDEWGNFSNGTEGRVGGVGGRCNGVAVRGTESSGYNYIGGTASNIAQLAFPGQAFRPIQTNTQFRKVMIYLTPVGSPATNLRVDVYLQVGYNQPFTQVLTNLLVGQLPPAQVKIGYAASTGGSNNYHEIRNLIVDPLPSGSDIDLAITKTVTAPTVTQGASYNPLYTITVRNYGPINVPANGVQITDTIPNTIDNVTWSCTPAANCGTFTASGNNFTASANLPLNGSATYTAIGRVVPATPAGTVISNTASLSPPAGIIDINPANNISAIATTVTGATISIAGTVYNDNGAGAGTPHNGIRDGTEAGVNAGLTYYAKLFRASDLSTTVVAPVQVNNSTGAFTFTNVPGYGSYIIILSTSNTANLYDPSFPANWTWVAPANYVLGNVVASGSNLTNQNFFVYNGSRITGIVINDNGANGAYSTAYDGILNAAETGIANVPMRLTDSTGTNIPFGATTTGSDGRFTLFTNVASATLRIYQSNLAGYISVSSNAGTTGGTYNLANDYLEFPYTQYTNYSGALFGDAPPVTITFTPTPRTATGTPAAPVYYPHTFTASGRGSLTFASNSRTQAGWPAVTYYLDNTCNGYDAGDTVISGPIVTAAGVNVCILAAVNIPNGTAPGTNDQLVTRATFTMGQSVQTLDVTDTTTVGNYPNLATSTKNWLDLNGGGQYPGDVLQYSIVVTESNGAAANGVAVSDTIDTAHLAWGGVTCPSGASCSYDNILGVLSVTGLNIPANGSATITYTVTILAATAGTTIDNTAIISLPGYPAMNAIATTVTLSGSVTGSGTKRLYLYDGTSTPAWKLSRTVNPVTATYATINTTTSQSWTMNPVAAGTITIDPAISATVPVVLHMRRSANSGNRTIRVDLQCSSGGTVLTQTQTFNMNATQTAYPFNLPLAAPLSCGQGNSWVMTVSQTAGTDPTRIYPYSGTVGASSRIDLPASTVINITSSAFYDAGGNVITAVIPPTPVYIRATVSDPFGSYDINGVNVTVKDPGNNPVVNAAAMTLLSTGTETPSLTKIFQYGPFTPVAIGSWNISVTAIEGTERTVTHTVYSTLPVVPMPQLTILKTAFGVTSGATARPGQDIPYQLKVSNSGGGIGTNIEISDALSPYVVWKLNTLAYADGTPSSGLSMTGSTTYYSYDKGITWSTTAPADLGGGYNGQVTNWKIVFNPSLTMNGSNAFFTISYQAAVR